jgi:NADH:ubiquinone oxidoreductase subunit B-like Fe-S oxidoreductase
VVKKSSFEACNCGFQAQSDSSVASPRKAPMLITSVAVVRKMLEAVAAIHIPDTMRPAFWVSDGKTK